MMMTPPADWVARVNEERALNGAPPLGRRDPALVSLWQSAALAQPPLPLAAVTGIS
jgi:hypothetical protein